MFTRLFAIFLMMLILTGCCGPYRCYGGRGHHDRGYGHHGH